MGDSFPTFRVDLASPARERWAGLSAHGDMARAMVAQYVGELARSSRDEQLMLELVQANEGLAVPAALREEIDSVARAIHVPRPRVLAANLYYDAFRVLMGCTAFAIDRDDGPLHARNLDWWTESNLLTRATVVTEFVNGPAGPFRTIGWPGLVGAFSGIAEGRFALTMNAVLSEERPTIATSTPALLRDVLETSRSYADARARLAATPIASDCLLLLTGTRAGELCVIERTSTRSAIREAEDGVVAVTNDYRALDAVSAATTVLAETACDRLDRAVARARAERPADPAAALRILRDPRIQMGITVQQMVLHAGSGAAVVSAPG